MKTEDNTAVYGTSEEQTGITSDQAFINSDGHKLNGLTLEPYTPERIWAADAMGLRHGKLSKADVRQWKKTGMYAGMIGDVGIVMWLCSLTDLGTVREARRDPDEAQQLAADFAVEHGIVNHRQKKFWEAYDVFLAIMDEVQAAFGDKDEKKTTPETKTKLSHPVGQTM